MNTRVLIAGATGYIGGRLLRALEEGGHAVRCLARRPEMVTASVGTTEVVKGDCLDGPSLDRALADVDAAYYLVHSMAAGASFAELDHQAALNFGRAAARAGVRRIVYLGGLGGDTTTLSTHLKSRTETGELLRQSGVPVIEFRASIVIGAGSLSFEMIEALVERLPAMICPRWVDTRTQPIAIDDVLAYLTAALDLPQSSAGIFEIGGPDVVSYGGMMRAYARLRGLRRFLIPVPVLTPRLSGLWLGLVTPAQATVGRALVEGLRSATVVRSDAARRVFAVDPMPMDAAFLRAIDEGTPARLKRDARELTVAVPPAQAFAPIRRIGGTTGWYYGTILWKSRSWLDRRLGGRGMSASRRHHDDCAAGDSIDGWSVDAYEPDRLLRLAAGLKLPGRGWIEWQVEPLDGGARAVIRQTASFDPRGIMGRLYWCAVLPLHALIFGGMLRRIGRVAESGTLPPTVSVFTHRSTLPIAADTVFRWHERPQALTDLAPKWLVTLERRTGDLREGRVVLSVGVWPCRVRWEARHFGYVAGRQFCDEQLSGPFAVWRHTHRTEPLDASRTLYEDRVEYAVRGGRIVNHVAAWLLRPVLAASFAQRHRIVREALTS